MTNLKIRKTLVALLFGMTAVLNSCVQEDWYELYDMDDVALSIRRKKNKSDIDFESNKNRQYFSNTCFIVAATCAGGNITLDNYLSNLDWFMTTYRYVSGINDTNRHYIVTTILGATASEAKNLANAQEMKGLLEHVTGYEYNYSPNTSMTDIISSISSRKEEGGYSDNNYVIDCDTENGGHVANYDPNSPNIIAHPSISGLSFPSGITSYVGYFYPNGPLRDN